MIYDLREFALWILPSSWLSRVCPGSERLSFTSIRGHGWAWLGEFRDPGFISVNHWRGDPLVVAKSMFFAGVEPQSTAKRTETIRFLVLSADLMTSKMRVRARSGLG